VRLKKFRRRGFTLVELLVVVAIIAILVALTTAAVMRFLGAGKGSATKTNLGKVHAKLRDQWKGVTDKANRDSLSDSNNTAYANAALALSSGANLADTRVKASYVYLRQVQAFPRTFNEAFWPDPSWEPATPQATAPNAWQGYVKYLNELGITPANKASWGTISQDVQTSVCLLMITEKGPSNTGTTADDLGTSTVGQITLPAGFPFARGIVDGWKRPVGFVRNNAAGQAATIQVVSAGEDGKFNTPDDIVVSNP